MAEAKKDPQDELEEMLAAQKLLEEQIKSQREIARQAALETIKRLYLMHEFQFKDVKDFIKVNAPRKVAAKKATATRKKRST